MDAWPEYFRCLDAGIKTRKPKPHRLFAEMDRLQRKLHRPSLTLKARMAAEDIMGTIWLTLRERHNLEEAEIQSLFQPMHDWIFSRPKDPALQEDALKAGTALRAKLAEVGMIPPFEAYLDLMDEKRRKCT